MDLTIDTDDAAFARGARDFLRHALPAEVQQAQRLTPTVYAEYQVTQRWHRILAAQGWAAPHWPSEFGGPGWRLVQRYLWEVECARAGAPLISPIGLSLVGPVVMHYGSPEQKTWVLPAILSGEHYWCQGFSEPGSGSDLAALRMQARRSGDHYIVNGTKIWTTHAHVAHWMVALARTQDTGKRQEGISFLLIDMRSAGISVRSIHTIGGDHEVNQVFFDEVRVPAANLVGREGQGWEIAKFLLEFERGGDFAAPSLRMAWAQIVELARGLPDGPVPCIDDPDIARAIAEVGIDIDALEMLELRLMSAISAGGSPGAMASMLKLRASQLQQDTAELAVKVLGEAALRWEYRRPLYEHSGLQGPEGDILAAMPRYLNSRANTIFGGSSEIQRGLIARMVMA